MYEFKSNTDSEFRTGLLFLPSMNSSVIECQYTCIFYAAIAVGHYNIVSNSDGIFITQRSPYKQINIAILKSVLELKKDGILYLQSIDHSTKGNFLTINVNCAQIKVNRGIRKKKQMS